MTEQQRNPEQNVLDEIDHLVDESIAHGPTDDYDRPWEELCRKCGDEWHGLPNHYCGGAFSDEPSPPDDELGTSWVMTEALSAHLAQSEAYWTPTILVFDPEHGHWVRPDGEGEDRPQGLVALRSSSGQIVWSGRVAWDDGVRWPPRVSEACVHLQIPHHQGEL